MQKNNIMQLFYVFFISIQLGRIPLVCIYNYDYSKKYDYFFISFFFMTR